MLARRGTPVRIVVGPVFPSTLPDVLSALSWPGSGECARRLAALPALNDYGFHADFDVAENTAPSLGLECSMLSLTGGQSDEVLGTLCDRGWIRPEAMPPLRRLVHPSSLHVCNADGEAFEFQLRLNHLKLQLSTDGQVAVKAYVSLLEMPIPLRGYERKT
jgi:hypothetical protein